MDIFNISVYSEPQNAGLFGNRFSMSNQIKIRSCWIRLAGPSFIDGCPYKRGTHEVVLHRGTVTETWHGADMHRGIMMETWHGTGMHRGMVMENQHVRGMYRGTHEDGGRRLKGGRAKDCQQTEDGRWGRTGSSLTPRMYHPFLTLILD